MDRKPMKRTMTCHECGYRGEPRLLRIDCYERWYCPECGVNPVDGSMDPTKEATDA